MTQEIEAYAPVECEKCKNLVGYFFTYEEWPEMLCIDCYNKKIKRKQRKK